MMIAGLDIATETGICLGEPGQKPEFFSRDLGQGKTHDLRFSNVMRLAHELIEERGVKFIGIEAPILTRKDNKAKVELLHGLIANVRGWAHLRGIDCRTFEVATLDKNFLGAAQRAGRDVRKLAIWRQCQARGWTPKTQDEADAGSVWDMACVTQCRSYAIHSTPLFNQGQTKISRKQG